MQMKAFSKAEEADAFSVVVLKKISTFLSEKFLRFADLYQYVLQELPDEVDIVKLVEVETPIIPIALMTNAAVN